MLLLIGGIVGTELAPSPSLVTLPIAVSVIGLAIFTIPAALVMKKIGRKLGFIFSAVVAAGAALVAAYAIGIGSFFLLCAAMIFIGGNMAFVQQYRFAAAESVETRHVGKAVSFVLLGGVLAGYLGPEIATRTRDWLGYGTYTGSFVTLALLFVVVAVLLSFLRDVALDEEEAAAGEERSLRSMVTQPTFVVAVMAGVIGYGVMSLIMTATPISMHVRDGYTLGETGWVIQGHVIAMYLPALFTGYLVGRLGVLRVMSVGVVVLFVCVALAVVDRSLMHYWGALVLLGLGWNLLFVAGTTLLTQSYHPAERYRAQAVNDFMIFGTQAFASLTAGAVIVQASWEILNLISLPFLLLLLAAILVLRHRLARPTQGGLLAVAGGHHTGR